MLAFAGDSHVGIHALNWRVMDAEYVLSAEERWMQVLPNVGRAGNT